MMADVPWYQAPNVAPIKFRASFEEGAQDAAKTRTAATEAERKRYELEGDKHIQEIAAKSIKPDGTFDPIAFKQQIKSSPYALSALKAYGTEVYPQAQKEAGQTNLPAMLTPEGGIDPKKAVAVAQDPSNLFGADAARAGLGMQAEIAKTAQGVGEAKLGTSLTTSPGSADPMSMQGIAEGQPRQLGAGANAPKATAEDVAKWSPEVLEARRDWLEAKGMPAKADAATVATWYNQGMQAKIQAATLGAYDPQKPGSMIAATARAPQAAQDYASEATGQGREIKSTTQAQTAKAMDIKGQKMTIGSVDEFRKMGFDGVNPSNLAEVQKIVGDVAVIKGAARQVDEMLKDKKGLGAMSDDNFAQEVFNAMNNIKVAEGVGTLAGDEHISSLFREKKSLGRIVAASSGPIDALKKTITNEVASSSREQVLHDIQALAKSAAANGVARSHLSKFGDGKLPGEWATTPMKGKSKAEPTYRRGKVE